MAQSSGLTSREFLLSQNGGVALPSSQYSGTERMLAKEAQTQFPGNFGLQSRFIASAATAFASKPEYAALPKVSTAADSPTCCSARWLIVACAGNAGSVRWCEDAQAA